MGNYSGNLITLVTVFDVMIVVQALEEQRLDLNKDVSELRANLHDVEQARMEARRESQELRRQCKFMEANVQKLLEQNQQMATEVKVSRRIEKDAITENSTLKQQVTF